MWWLVLLLAQAPMADLQRLIQDNALPEARTRIQSELKQHPSDPQLLNLLGVVEARSGNSAGAEQSFRKALTAAPKSVPVLLNLARLYQKNVSRDPGAPGKAETTYRKILQLDPKNAESRYQLAFLLAQGGNCTESLAALHQLSPAQLETPQALSLAVACESEADARKAAEHKLLAHPGTQIADITGALPGLARENRLEEGMALTKTAAQRFGLSPELLIWLAKFSYQKHDYQEALGYLGHARDLVPQDAAVHFFLGITAIEMDLVVEAKNSLSEAVKLEPENAYYRYALGAVLSEQRDAAQAIPHFEKYCELRPNDPRGKFAIAVAYFQSNQMDEAERDLRKLMTNSETAAGAHYFLGRIAKFQNRLDDAQRELSVSLKLVPSNLDARAELAQVYQRQKLDAQAEKEIGIVLKTEPDHYLANLTLLALYQRQRDPRVAAQKARLEQIQAIRKEKDRALWRTIEFRPQ